MSNILIIVAAVAAFVISSVIGKFLIPELHRIKFGQPIRDEGPKWHQKKSGTPTMGGIMFIVAAVLVSVICYAVPRSIPKSSMISRGKRQRRSIYSLRPSKLAVRSFKIAEKFVMRTATSCSMRALAIHPAK